MFAPTAGLTRLIQIGEGSPIYLAPYEGATLGAVVTEGFTTYIPIKLELERGHLVPSKVVGEKVSEMRKLGASQLSRQFSRGFSLSGKDRKVYWTTEKFSPKPGFSIPKPTIENIPALRDLPLLNLVNNASDKLRSSFPVVFSDSMIAGFSEFLAVSIEHDGAFGGSYMFAPERIAKLGKDIVGAYVDDGSLWLFSKKGEVRKIPTVLGRAPLYNSASTHLEGVGGELPLKDVKTWLKNLTKIKGYIPVKLFEAGKQLRLLAPGSGILDICDVGSTKVKTQYFDGRHILAIVKAWVHATITIQASIGGDSPLIFKGGGATVSLCHISEYKKC